MGIPTWVQYKAYSGIKIAGTVEFVQPLTTLHMERAVWLTSRLEAPRWGSIQSYDGAGMSGGLLHNIAVQPRSMEQGSLFALLRAIVDDSESMDASATGAVWDMETAFHGMEWKLAPDGKLRRSDGTLVPGKEIRETFTPPNGQVPRRGREYNIARVWAERFHALLSSQSTFRAQSRYAALWLASGNKVMELDVYRKYVSPALDSMISVSSPSLPAEIDLAMCVYHSFSVNGPAPAQAELRNAMPLLDKPEKFAARLIRNLGTSTYGRWKDDPDDKKSRYDATRLAVWRCNWWPTDLAKRLMPKDL